ncbi:hypothetical protein QQ045_012524 [Rhodiola kirilowii]
METIPSAGSDEDRSAVSGPRRRTTKEVEWSNLVTNGSVDYKGNVANKLTTGGWKASPYVIANEVAERIAFYAIAVSLVSYLFFEMNHSLPDAATNVTNWIGAAFVLTILGAFIADAYLGRFKTIIVFSCIYAVGMILLTISASIDDLRPPPCTARPNCTPATTKQSAFLNISLALIAIGTGGIKPCVSSFGADQFDEADEKELVKKYSFFNWFFFAINTGALIGITLLVYLEVKAGWIWGFGVPTATMILSVFVLLCGLRFYRHQKPAGSAFTRFLQVLVVAVRNNFRGVRAAGAGAGEAVMLYEVGTTESDIVGARKLPHTDQYSFLDKAAVVTDPEAGLKDRWRLCTVTQVEEFKCFVRVLPVWATTIALALSFSQLATFFVSQASLTNRDLGPNFEIPAGSVTVFSAINAVFLVPIYEVLIVPVLRHYTGHRRGLTSLQRMGVGLFISIFAMMSAALVEKMRRDHFPKKFSMSVFWLFPQFFLMGGAEVFAYVGQLEFFYDEATDGTRSISSAMFLSGLGIGSWLSTALVKIVEATTGGQEKGWLRSNLNKSKLDNFYWILAAINAVNFLVYLWVSSSYKGKNSAKIGSFHDETLVADLKAHDGTKADADLESKAF